MKKLARAIVKMRRLILEKNSEFSAPRWLCGACPDPDGQPLSARLCGDQGPLLEG